jgi:hypothetical protein
MRLPWRGICPAFVFIFLGCQKSSDSNTTVAGGREESGYPSVKMLLADKTKAGVCTGVAVSHNAIIIAGHCVKDGTIDWSVRSPDTGKDATKIVMWPQVTNRQRMSVQDAAYDLAVLVYPPNSVKPPYAVIGQSLPAVGSNVKIVGYGATSFEADASVAQGKVGRKNSGATKITRIDFAGCEDDASQCKERVIVTHAAVRPDGSLDGAAAAPGDSGSPLFLQNTPGGDQTPTIVGISAAVGARDSKGTLLAPSLEKGPNGDFYAINIRGAAMVENLYVDLTSPASATILQLATCFGAVIPGYASKPDCQRVPDEFALWMQKPAPNFIGSGNYVSIASILDIILGFISPRANSTDSNSTSGDTSSTASISAGSGPFGFLRSLFSGFGFGVKSSDSATSSPSSTTTDTAKEDETKKDESAGKDSSTDKKDTAAVSPVSEGSAAVTASSATPTAPTASSVFAKDNSAFWNSASQAANAQGNTLTQQQKDQINAMATACGGNVVRTQGCDPGSVWKTLSDNRGSTDLNSLNTSGQALSKSQEAWVPQSTSVPAASVSSAIYNGAHPQAPTQAPAASFSPATPTPSAQASAQASVQAPKAGGAAVVQASQVAAAKPQVAGAAASTAGQGGTSIVAAKIPPTTKVAPGVIAGAQAAAAAKAPAAPRPAVTPAPQPPKPVSPAPVVPKKAPAPAPTGTKKP